MATKIIEFDTLSMPDLPEEGWPGYSSVLVLFKRGRRTLNAQRLPLAGGQIDDFEFDRAAANALRHRHDLLVRERFAGSQIEDSPPISVSVVICSRDRAAQLDRCLAALAACDPQPMEILVVDNATADDSTARMAEQHGVRCEREDRPGLNWARARGAAAARGEIVAYIDDDVVVTSGWLTPFARRFGDPSLAGLTGLVMPYRLDDRASEMFENYCGFVRGYQHRTFTLSSIKPMGAANIGAGACMAFRRDIVNDLRLFNVELDAGTATRTGGDTYAFYRLITLGYRIDYDPDVVVRHQHRDSEDAVVSTLRDYSVGTYVFFLHCFLRHRESHALMAGMRWFRSHHLRQLTGGLLGRPRAQPLRMTLAEIRGCFAAPLAYLKARLNDRRHTPPTDDPVKAKASA
ncbi:MAG: glycosyltransferase family 2 protein [Gammaproteobacteria bacterium]